MSGLARAYAQTPTHLARVTRSLHDLGRLAGRRWAVCWSGGKDSTICLALAAQAWQDGIVVTSDNHAASGALADLVARWAQRAPHLDFVVRPSLHPDGEDRATLRRLLHRLDVQGVVLGLRASESGYRRRLARTMIRDREYRTAEHWGRLPALCPILDWSLDDVWAYAEAHDLPMHACYAHDHARRSPSRHTPWAQFGGL